MPVAIPEAAGLVPALTRIQMIELDRIMRDELGIDRVRMMEIAGASSARLCRARFLGGAVDERVVVVFAGAGRNGGAALVCARRLHAWGAAVMVCLASPAALFRDIAAAQLEILDNFGIPIIEVDDVPPGADVLIDGLIGFHLHGPPRGTARELIKWMNVQSTPILSLDLPSGVDATTGPTALCVKADATIALALPKAGLFTDAGREAAGEIYLTDIGAPPSAYAREEIGLSVADIFSKNDLVRLL